VFALFLTLLIMVFIKIPVEKFNIKFEEGRSLFQSEFFIYIFDDLDFDGMDDIVSYNQNSLTFEIHKYKELEYFTASNPIFVCDIKSVPFFNIDESVKLQLAVPKWCCIPILKMQLNTVLNYIFCIFNRRKKF